MASRRRRTYRRKHRMTGDVSRSPSAGPIADAEGVGLAVGGTAGAGASKYKLSLAHKGLKEVAFIVGGEEYRTYEINVRLRTDVGQALFKNIALPVSVYVRGEGKVEVRQLLNMLFDLASSAQLQFADYVKEVWGIRSRENVEESVIEEAHEHYLYSRTILKKLRACGIRIHPRAIEEILQQTGRYLRLKGRSCRAGEGGVAR